MELLHRINIGIHVISGIVALLIGAVILFLRKGNGLHVKTGKWYIKAMIIVVLTGLIGVLVFKRNIFLLLVTILSGYTAWSGVRTLRLRGEKPLLVDILVPIGAMITALGYLYYLQHAGLFWAPVVTGSILSALFFVTFYDLLRLTLTFKIRSKLYLYEHIYKMMSSFIALTSAFTGTIFPNYKPYSQILPGVLGWLYIIGAIIYFSKGVKKKASLQKATMLNSY